MIRPARLLIPLLSAALMAVWLPCWAQSERPKPEPAPQEITFRVLSAQDRPVAGAKIEITPTQGAPAHGGPWQTGPKGECQVTWLPQVKDENPGGKVLDLVYSLNTGLTYRITAQGFWPMEGKIERRLTGRQMASPELASLNKIAKPRPWMELVVLRRPQDLLGPELAQRPASDPLLKRLLAFHHDLAPVARTLGAAFAWPAFKLNKEHLSILFDWQGMAWAGLKQAPLKSRVAVSAGLPLSVAVGEDLAGLPGVGRITIAFASETTPSNDPYALPQRTVVSITAPVEDYQGLAQGGLNPDAFLDRNPLQVSRDRGAIQKD